MLEICALASGSNGNCYYIGNENEAVLIDAGIYYKRLLERLEDANLDKSKIRAVFITHEHTDHVMGVSGCTKKLNIPAFFTQKTYYKAQRKHRPENVSFFETGKMQTIGKINVHPFSKMHDAADPCSFRVECQGKNIGVFTDIGLADETLQHEFSKCQIVFLETNYDKEMLWNGSYPPYIKQRVDSDFGHLSNEQALELTKKFASPELKYIFLSHISEKNNTPEQAMQTFLVLNGKYIIKPTSRAGISEVLRF
jgi:phosphoribosyl 1,2-cyclic phosphodiesterase